jgi:guanylate cyclase
MVRFLDRLSDLGAGPEDSADERLRHGTLIFASVLIALISLIWIATYFAYGYHTAAAIPALYQLITVVGLVVLARTRRFGVFRTTQLLAFLVLPALLQASLGGFVASSAMILWAIFTPLVAVALQGLRRSVVWLVSFFAVLVVLALLDPRLSQDPAALPSAFVITFFVLNVMGLTLSAYVMLGYFVEQRDRAHRALETERERSERLLLNVLPGPIAERLKVGSGVIADHYDTVSVLFADLVGFTERSAVMAADELVALLDEIFSSFDRLADAAGVEKIKTIGDAYMVAGGLPEPRPDHLEAVARMALAMRDEITAIAERTGRAWLAVRIGIDTGPVVAGVIGRRKFIYDLWGDTVNTASRMESHGLPGEIQVTDRVAVALGPGFVVRPRGTSDLKGKGPMATFLIDGADQLKANPPN